MYFLDFSMFFAIFGFFKKFIKTWVKNWVATGLMIIVFFNSFYDVESLIFFYSLKYNDSS
jgi:hypothetical protein